ncbi:FtsW/RodA/SpoVE family cell cycle protein, partial [Paucibacter sp. O1-1]|nr:FtsW/RodA/SpoVE family cell cycle protein [Paucibacter sp. O1-1]MDA3831731.1 FtsW/RodA/SpoVE family cell cycle protein [Paucibacter sp. O1-1]
IFAVAVEEYGTLGGTILIVLYLILLYRGLKAIEATKRPFGGLLSAGLTFIVVSQAFFSHGSNGGTGACYGADITFFQPGRNIIVIYGHCHGHDPECEPRRDARRETHLKCQKESLLVEVVPADIFIRPLPLPVHCSKNIPTWKFFCGRPGENGNGESASCRL